MILCFRFITHGWNNNFASEVNTMIRTAYMNRGDFNVIVVDWGVGANTINYIAAANRIQQVGPVIAQFCDFLAVSVGVNYEHIYLIGHSLGAHASGVAGKTTSRGRIHTIFGLDPAGPLFHMDRPRERIDASDARYVENIITNGGTLGFFEPIGVSSFYPNWGNSQPGCGLDLSGACAHGRAYEYFAESLSSASGFMSTQCINHAEIVNRRCTSSGPRVQMGGEPSNWGRASGIYWVQTNSATPFSLL
jgi:pancreatic triacylglycerol lipase